MRVIRGIDIFEAALDIIGERQSDGSAPPDVSFFRSRAVSYINIVLAECAPYQARLCGEVIDFAPIDSLDDELDIDSRLSLGAMPYGVASLYLLAEGDSRYELFRTIFENMLLKVMRYGTAKTHSIADVY
ncbi:MAG: hypothetical protein J6L23_02585 [Clostridia bacterium]|nr:hypothetical protein [Clostridia bacterium]MBQ6906639.1 hypothetical protein [Clostridia bacterium]